MANPWGEKFKQAAQSFLPPNKRLEMPVEVITLKQLTKGSGFGRSILCSSGQITLIDDAESPRAESFRQAVLGRAGNGLISIRVGPDELRRSEMYVVGSNDFTWEAKTVFDCLSKAGIPSSAISELLAKVGLAQRSSVAPKNLEPLELRKVGILQSLYSKSRLTVYDKPFLGMDEKSRETLASLIYERALKPDKVILVLGESILPSVWQEKSEVRMVQPEKQKAPDELGVLDTTNENTKLAQLVKKLSANSAPSLNANINIGRSALVEKGEEFFVTRPQMIFDSARGKNSSTLRSEVINNPHAPEEIISTTTMRSPSKVQRTSTGTLTRLTWKERLKKSRTPRFYLRLALRATIVTAFALTAALLRKVGVL